MRSKLFTILNPSETLFNKLLLLRGGYLLLATGVGILQHSGFAHWSAISLYMLLIAALHMTPGRSDLKMMSGLLLDICAMSFLLQVNEGVLSGWVSLLLLPALVGSVALASHLAWAVAGVSMLGYASLMMVYLQSVSAHAEHGHHGASMTEHLMGMLLTFFVSVVLLTLFLTYQSKQLRLREKQLNSVEKQSWRDRHILAMATLTANTTHQLATPVSTTHMLIEEILEMSDEQSDAYPLLKQAHNELGRCQTSLRNLVKQARQMDFDQTDSVPLTKWLEQTTNAWWASRNEVHFELTLSPQMQHQVFPVNDNLTFALVNLLDNAADACRNAAQPQITLQASVRDNCLQLTVEDNGEGISDALQADIGAGFVDSEQGLGVGITLAQSAIEQAGGSISMTNKSVGVTTHVSLPVEPRDMGA